METNFLIIGSGAAGLTLAVKLARAFPAKKITVVTKAHQAESNTKYAQGGVAAVFNLQVDSFGTHIEDTLIAGDGLCDEEVVEMVVRDGPARLRELMEWGARFDTDSTGAFHLGREGGHSEFRVLHHKDTTGNEIEQTLLVQVEQLKNIVLLPHHFAIDLITEHHFSQKQTGSLNCHGAYVLDQISGSIIAIKAHTTTLASGGLGRIYGHTTNPSVATGDGIAMAYRAKARIKNMEFIQFHPTALYDGEQRAAFLISEAVRGFGAYLVNKRGERFMGKYDSRAELASRDIVARAIESEMKKWGDPCVFLDCTHLDANHFQEHFPAIYKTCADNNIDISTHWIPVVPAAHYLCGGVVVDRYGRTSINRLFACGECSYTGLHGANRLASNSLLEALVYAHAIFQFHQEHPKMGSDRKVPEWDEQGVATLHHLSEVYGKIEQLQSVMRTFAGVVRSGDGLRQASELLDKIYRETEELYRKYKMNTALSELRNMVNVSYLIVQQSLQRTENRGGYFNTDFVKNKKTLIMNELIKQSVNKAMDYAQYNLLFRQLAEEGRTTGEQDQEKIEYTKLNFSRSKRLDKTAKISEEAAEAMANISQGQTWLVITEPWCGDAAQTLPFLNKLAENSENVELKLVLRDENLELMDRFLTNGSRSIPMVIILDENLEVVQQWGPRSKAATKLVSDYKEEHGTIDDAFKEMIQVWYNNDKGTSLVGDFVETLKVNSEYSA